jgi:Kef-type K+ transport system membrane component KefB
MTSRACRWDGASAPTAPRRSRRDHRVSSTTLSFVALLVVAIAAVVAPMLAELVPRGLLPPVVLEVVAGIVLGPQMLGWLHVDVAVEILSVMGLTYLLFLAGMELTPGSMWNKRARLGLVVFAAAVALSFPLALALKAVGANGDIRILALALTSTSLGVLVPVLRDAGEAGSPFGQTVLVTATVGEFASLLLFTVLFSADPKSTPVQVLYVVGLAVSGVVAVVLIRMWWGSRWFKDSLERLDDTTSQLRVRSAFVLLLLFAALVSGFGLDSVLGAFVAGIVLRIADEHSSKADEDRFMAKLNAIGFGFLVPVFFIATGAKLDVRAVVDNGRTLALVPLFLLGMIIARGVPAFVLLHRRMTTRGALASGAFQATSLTFPIIVATIGTSLHFIGSGTAAALIAAGLVSVVVLPAFALLLRPWEEAGAPTRGGSADLGIGS